MKNKDNQLRKTEIEELKKQVEELKKQVEEFKNKYLRALADYQNLEKRVLSEREEIVKDANKELILNLLPFLDILDKAEIFIKDPGLKSTKEEFIKILNKEGLEEISVLGKTFDPEIAEVIEIVQGDKENEIVEVLRKGYKLNDKILRVAQVKVSKKLKDKNS